jgi:glycerophosphoryl diester phosphodiesterase
MQIIGHRGAPGYEPENTLASFEKALALGVDMIELDVYALKTGELVVMHDATVDRTTNGTGRVEKFSLKQLHKLHAGNDERIPLLSEALDLVNKKVPINIELKGKNTAGPVAELIDSYVSTKGWTYDLFLVSSFRRTELAKFMKLNPSVHAGALFVARAKRFLTAARKGSEYSLNLNALFITNKTVKEAHRQGLKVFAYTVNSKKMADHMNALHVDGIFTNYPDRVSARAPQV